MQCKGKNCGATDGVNHSAECLAEHLGNFWSGLNMNITFTDLLVIILVSGIMDFGLLFIIIILGG